MIVWIDAQLSPALAPWIRQHFGVEAFSASFLGYRDATDREIYRAARQADAIVMTKDSDFVQLSEELGPPPRILWVTLGNTSNARMKEALQARFREALAIFEGGEHLVELGEDPSLGRS